MNASDLSITDRIDIWDSLVFGWTYLSESEIKKYKPKKLCAIRRQRLMSERVSDFDAALEADFPNRVRYPWDGACVFDNVDDLCSREHQNAGMIEEMASDNIIRCKIARARFRALYLDPTLIWIKGTYLESKSGDTVSRHGTGWMMRDEIGDRDYLSWDFLTEEDRAHLYRLRYPSMIENYLFDISRIYGNCGIVNALRLVILYGGFGFDGFGRILEAPLFDIKLSEEDFCWIASNVISDQRYEKLPFGYPYDEHFDSGRKSLIGKGCMQIRYIPKSQREAMMQGRSVLNAQYTDDNSLCDALITSWKKLCNWPTPPSGESPKKLMTENMVRALCELDGVDPTDLGIMEEILSPVGEAYDCLMREPAWMVRSRPLEECESLVEEFKDYWRSRRRHGTTYNSWLFRQCSSAFEKTKSFLSAFLGAAFLAILPGAIPEAALFFTFSGGKINILDVDYWFLPIGIAVLVGTFAAIWDMRSWPITVWWDRKIRGIPIGKRWLYEPATLGGCLLAAFIGSFIGFVVSLISGNVNAYSRTGLHYAIVIAFAILFVLLSLRGRMPSDWRSLFDHKFSEGDAVRSEWEEQIARHVANKFPSLEIETNNRTIIRSQGRGNSHYEIDIWIPELSLGIEANGEQYHDHKAYKQDVRDGTSNSREMYKEKYCDARGIKLVHVWSSESMDHIFDTIDYEIGKRMQNVSLRPIA